jgi:hypothetical protein
MRTTIRNRRRPHGRSAKGFGQTKKQTVEQALRLLLRLRRQSEVGAAFGQYRWRGDLARSAKAAEPMMVKPRVIESSALLQDHHKAAASAAVMAAAIGNAGRHPLTSSRVAGSVFLKIVDVLESGK